MAHVPAGAALVVVILGGGLWLAVPGRRRRIGLGRTVRPADAVLVAVLSLTGALPWPLLVAPAAAQKGGTPAPTATPVPAVEIHHYHLDHLGSPQTITDGGGAIVHQVRYDPYGAVRGRWRPTTGGGYTLTLTALSEQDRREFTGYHLEPLSQLSYAGARFYDPPLATFLNHDPAREFASPYTYTGGNPINLNDPGGACAALCIDLLIVVAVGAAAGFAANAIQAAVSGASIGDIFKAGAIGAAMGAAGAGLGFAAGMAASAALTSAYGQAVSQTVMRAVGITMILGGAGQAAYGLTKGDYTGLIGMGISIGMGFALGQDSHPADLAGPTDGLASNLNGDTVSDAPTGVFHVPESIVEATRLQGLQEPLLDPFFLVGLTGVIAGMAFRAAIGVGAAGAKTALQAGISARHAARIQNAATRTKQRITVVGSRANGTAKPQSDWDYVMSGRSSQRHSAASSVPRGSAGGEINRPGLDIWQSYNPNAPGYTVLDPRRPHVIFDP